MSVIEVTGLHKRYGTTVAVDDVSLRIEQGEIFGILGPNGAGKTTTVECIAGLRDPDQGDLRVLGLDPRSDRAKLTEYVGVQLQQAKLQPKLRVGEALQLYSAFYPDPADPDTLLDLLGLYDQRATAFAKLSGGQQQRLSIALALIGNPQIAILDELTTGLDPQARRETWELVKRIRDRGVTVVLVTHFMEEAERLCDRLALIDAGQVAAIDSPEGLVARVGAQETIRFRPRTEFADSLLSELDDVTQLSRDGDQVIVTGTDNVLAAVTATLARNGIVAAELRVDQPNLDDAFLTLTGRTLGSVEAPAPHRDGASATGSASGASGASNTSDASGPMRGSADSR